MVKGQTGELFCLGTGLAYILNNITKQDVEWAVVIQVTILLKTKYIGT